MLGSVNAGFEINDLLNDSVRFAFPKRPSVIFLDFLKVVRLVFWSGVAGPGTNDFYPLQRAKFTGGIFLL